MAVYLPAYRYTKGNEGGLGSSSYANHPSDRGGETIGGVARNYHPRWIGWQLVDHAKNEPDWPKCLDREPYQSKLRELVPAFYKPRFWEMVGGDIIPDQKLAMDVFDAAVHNNPSQASEWLQIALNVTNVRGSRYPDIKVDGRIGPKTVEAICHHLRIYGSSRLLVFIIEIHRGGKAVDRMLSDESQEDFVGWYNRFLRNISQLAA